ncbi:MAG: hypothetical protein HQK76_20070 [Desulfobacterales bacterium]|nr:hypothetical protein [Desulfobacterales bacterium]
MIQTNKKNSWKQYVKEQAENFGISFKEAWELFCVLGPSEAYDAFIVMLEDYSNYNSFISME